MDSSPYDTPKSNDAERGDTLRTKLLRTAGRFGIDGAVGFGVATRAWQLITGQVTMLVMVFCYP